jgi:lipopolysaccharide transport system permease protein
MGSQSATVAVEDGRAITIRRPRAHGWRPGGNIRELAQYADLFRTLTEHRIRVRYKQSLLGPAWAILQPLSMMLIFTLVFGRIARMPTDGVPYALFAFSGLLVWSFVSTSLNNSTQALVNHAQLITKVYFPREILPLSYVAAALFDLFVGGIVLLAILAWYGRPITPHLVLALPVIATAAMLTTAIAFALSALHVRFRDVGIAVPLLLYLWMFSTPIAYPLSQVPVRYRRVFELNPLTGIVEGFRDVILRHHAPSPALLAVPLLTAAVLLPIAYALFKRAEATMADVI